MKDPVTKAPSNGFGEDHALEFDFGIRAPIRRLVIELIEKGWPHEDIVLGFREISAELRE